MKTILIAALFASATLLSMQSPPTADEVVAKNMAARGGLDKIRAIQSMRLTGTLTLPDGTVSPIIVYAKRPNKMRQDLDIHGSALVRVYDGAAGWEINPFAANTGAAPLTGTELANMQDQAMNAIGGPLADYQAHGNKIEMVPSTDAAGASMYKLKITLQSGHVSYVDIDAKTFLEVSEQLDRVQGGDKKVIEETVSDYQSYAGALFASTFVSNEHGTTQKYILHIEKAAINTPIEDSLFVMPSPAPAPAPAPVPDAPKPADPKPGAP